MQWPVPISQAYPDVQWPVPISQAYPDVQWPVLISQVYPFCLPASFPHQLHQSSHTLLHSVLHLLTSLLLVHFVVSPDLCSELSINLNSILPRGQPLFLRAFQIQVHNVTPSRETIPFHKYKSATMKERFRF